MSQLVVTGSDAMLREMRMKFGFQPLIRPDNRAARPTMLVHRTLPL